MTTILLLKYRALVLPFKKKFMQTKDPLNNIDKFVLDITFLLFSLSY